MFCDLVGSSSLSTQLDPEDLRDLILWYQQICTEAIERFGGTVSRYVGDGIMALFGYPLAHENDAERAVCSGLEIVSAIAAIPNPDNSDPLAVRIGVATGVVIVGDLIGEGAAEEQAVVGETPNLAARLQAVASPNSLVIATLTRTLVGERFDCQDLGVRHMHGFTEPVRVWRVFAHRTKQSRPEATYGERLPLIDRQELSEWLLGLWSEAEHSHGKVALLAGHAGIGKSRIVRGLRESLADRCHMALRYQCSPYYVNTALHPLIEHLEQAAGIGREDTQSVKLQRLESWLRGMAQTPDALPLLAALLSIPMDGRFPPISMSPQRQKERTFELLFGFIENLASLGPLLVIVEDVHWIDPTTRELLTRFVERVRTMRILAVVTFRPEEPVQWREYAHVECRDLEGLQPEYAMRLARHVASDRLSPEVVEQVVARTDGVPLFIEELTKAVIEVHRPELEASDREMRSTGQLFAIPATLQDSLMARLDRLGPAKGIAQIAGAIGREFSYELLEAVSQVPATELRESLHVLEGSGLVGSDLQLEGETYAFKHALVQEAAYSSLLRSRRRQLHQRIADVLETQFPQTARDAPELVAHHWTEAGATERAVAAWLAAGRRASQRSECREAVGHLRRGLELIPRLDSEETRRKRELELLLAVAPALITTEGAGTPEAAGAYTRAIELCGEIADPTAEFAAQWGWWRICMDHRTGRERADKLIELARRARDPALLLQAHHCQWATLYMLGAHRECCRQADAGLALYEPNRDSSHATLYGGHDARVCALGESALSHWILGQPRLAAELAQAALAWAAEIAHVGSRAHAMDYALVLHKFRRDIEAVYEQARELEAFAVEQNLRVHRAKGAFFRGWARALREDVTAGLEEMLEGIASERAADTPHDFALYFEMLAEIYQRGGQLEAGLRAVNDGFSVSERHGIVFWNAELHRRRGELLVAGGEYVAGEAEFREALACARDQEARSLELRAAISLTRLHERQGNRATASEVLRPLHDSFRQDPENADLIEARELLGGRA